MKHTTLIFFLILFSGCSMKQKSATSLEHAVSSAIIAKSISFSTTIIPTPNNPKIGDVCPQCNNPPGKCGVGKVGDGIICDTCLTCNGDGIINEKDLNSSDEKPNQTNESNEVKEVKEVKEVNEVKEDNYIIMYTGPGCVWCAKWEKEVMPKLLKVGWKVKKIDATSGPIPTFEMKLVGKNFKHTGYMSLTSFNSYAKQAKDQNARN